MRLRRRRADGRPRTPEDDWVDSGYWAGQRYAALSAIESAKYERRTTDEQRTAFRREYQKVLHPTFGQWLWVRIPPYLVGVGSTLWALRKG